MANKDTSKQWFEMGDYPTQAQFAQVFDWLRWKDEGISIADVANLQNFLNTLQTTLNSIIPNQVISGGLVTIKSDDGTNVVLQIDATVYSLKGIAYSAPHSEITIVRPVDNTKSRFDVFYLDANGFKVLKGTESAAPVKPQLQSGMELTTILIGFDNNLETQPMPGTPNLQAVTLAGNKTTAPLISKDSLAAGQAATDIVGKIKADNLTDNRDYQLPDKSGTFATLDDVTGAGAVIDDTAPSLVKVYSSQKTEDELANKVDTVAGKQLSTEDYTTDEKTKLGGLTNYDDTAVVNALGNKVDKVAGKQLSTEDYTTTEKAKLAGLSNGGAAGAPYAVASGTNIYTASFTPAITAITEGMSVKVKFVNGNTGPSTFNPDGLGAINIYKGPATALPAGAIPAGQIFELYFDGTVWQLGAVQVVPTSPNKVITTNSSGALQAINDLIDINSTTTEATLIAANWSAGQATAPGVPGTRVYGISSGYLYECSGTNTWWRTPLTTWIELYLPDVSDGTGVKTSAQMAALYPTAVAGNRVKGVAGLYEFLSGFLGWVYYAFSDSNTAGTATFSGDGSATTFSVAFSANIILPTAVIAVPNTAAAAAHFYINNISISGFNIVFITAPPAGSNNIVFKFKAVR
ncbi:MAG TPA: hypothetical protein VIQ77_06190 [Mucilaginibacter sp.]